MGNICTTNQGPFSEIGADGHCKSRFGQVRGPGGCRKCHRAPALADVVCRHAVNVPCQPGHAMHAMRGNNGCHHFGRGDLLPHLPATLLRFLVLEDSMSFWTAPHILQLCRGPCHSRRQCTSQRWQKQPQGCRSWSPAAHASQTERKRHTQRTWLRPSPVWNRHQFWACLLRGQQGSGPQS